MAKNMAASVRSRLLNQSRATQYSYNDLLDRYTRERFLYRLSQSELAQQYILKGASVFQVWLGNPHRNTRDIDLLGFGSNDPKTIEKVFTEVCRQDCNDGIKFTTVESSVLQAGQKHEGVRLNVEGLMGTAKLFLQVDVGYGHAVTPPAQVEQIPTLLDLPSPSLKVYPKETVVAEKFQAICDRGLQNSRVKDYFDLYYLQRSFEFDGQQLKQAIKATFDQRQTSLDMSELPIGLTEEFVNSNRSRENQWRKIVKQSTTVDFPSLRASIRVIANFIMPVARATSESRPFHQCYSPRVGWEQTRVNFKDYEGRMQEIYPLPEQIDKPKKANNPELE